MPGDFVTALLGELSASKEPGRQGRLRRARLLGRPDRVEAAGGTALMNRVGHAFIKKRMRDENAVFGGEVSGHFYFRDNWFADNGMIPALLVLEMLANGIAVQRAAGAPARQVPHLGRDQLEGGGCPPFCARIERYADGRIFSSTASRGLRRLALQRARLEHRALIRLNLEALPKEEMERRRDEVLAIIRG